MREQWCQAVFPSPEKKQPGILGTRLSRYKNRMALRESALKFVVFLGSVRDGNFGQRAAKFIVKKLEARGHQTTLLGKLPLSHVPLQLQTILTSVREILAI